MLNLGRKPFNNKAIREYSLKCTNEYMKKLIDKNNNKIDNKNDNIKINLNNFSQQSTMSSSYPNDNIFNLIPFFVFLSVSSFIYFFQTKLIKN